MYICTVGIYIYKTKTIISSVYLNDDNDYCFVLFCYFILILNFEIFKVT